MFSIFNKKKKAVKKTSKQSSRQVKPSQNDPLISPQRQALIDQAMANTRKAKQELGEENIKRIAKALEEQESSIVEQCKRKIASMDEEKVADGVKSMLHDDKYR